VRQISLDTNAMSNPALTSVLLSEFVQTYQAAGKGSPTLPLAFIVLPIAMSRSTVASFAGTNRSTGFLTWLSRNPQLSLQIPSKVRLARQITGEALSFGLAYGLLQVTAEGTLQATKKRIKLARKNINEERMSMVAVARNLGAWTSQLSDAMVFFSLGMVP
jgi:hypothetical protein